MSLEHTVTHLSLSWSASAPNAGSSNEERGGVCFSCKNLSLIYGFLLGFDDKEKLKRNLKSREKEKEKEPGRFYVFFSNHITKSLIASREFTSLSGNGRTEGRERKKEGREGCGSCFLKQCYKKQLKNPYYSQVVKIITFQNSFFFLF